MTKRKERRFSALSDAENVVEEELKKRLENANTAMGDINIRPRGYSLTRKAEVAEDLNWTVGMSLPKDEVTGTFIVGKKDNEDDEDAGIYLKDNE